MVASMNSKSFRLLLLSMLLPLALIIGACSSEESSVPPAGNGTKTAAGGNSSATQVAAMLNSLVVASEQREGYDRDAFAHWSDFDEDSCDTRDEILTRENREPTGADCDAESGSWYSAYDGETSSDAGSFDVDHMVPLAEAWDSGAGQWDSEKRELYANDEFPYSLIAVTASSNRSKSDQDPSEWMPTLTTFQCQYVARWISVKSRWRLTIDQAEKDALTGYITDCSAQDLKLDGKLIAAQTPPKQIPSPQPGGPAKPDGENEKPRVNGKGDPRYTSCSAATADGYGPYSKGRDKEYRWYDDGDGDGTVCE